MGAGWQWPCHQPPRLEGCVDSGGQIGRLLLQLGGKAFLQRMCGAVEAKGFGPAGLQLVQVADILVLVKEKRQ